MFRHFPKSKPARLGLLLLSALAILSSGLYGVYSYVEDHATRILKMDQSATGMYMVVAKSAGVLGGWKMELLYQRKGEPWAVYSLALANDCWKQVNVTEFNGHASISASGQVMASLDLHSLLLDNPVPHQAGTGPIYLVQSDSPFNKSAFLHPGDAGWPSQWPQPSLAH